MQSKDYRSTVLPPELQRMSLRMLDFNCLNAAASKLMVEHIQKVASTLKLAQKNWPIAVIFYPSLIMNNLNCYYLIVFIKF